MNKRKYLASALLSSAIAFSTLGAVTPAYAADADAPLQSSLTAVVSGGSVDLKWGEVKGAYRYKVQVATDTNFTDIKDQAETHARNYTSRVNLGISSPRQLYWRVQALTQAGWTSWSDYKPVTIGAMAAPATETPSAGEIFNYPNSVGFRWNTVPGAQSYDVEWAVDGNFESSNKGTAYYVAGTSFTPNQRINQGDWGWRVRARLSGGGWGEQLYSKWSEPVSFKVNRLASPQLLEPAPASGSVPAVSDPIFKWTAVPGAAYYKILITRADTNTFISENVYGTTYVPQGNLLNGEYFWTVTAYDGANQAGQEMDPQLLFKQWGSQPERDQANVDRIEAKPDLPTPEVHPQGGGLSKATAHLLKLDDIELKWYPVPRASKYQVYIWNPNNPWEPEKISCWTSNNSITLSSGYTPGAQSPGLFASDGDCNVGMLSAIGPEFAWRVRAIDASATGEKYNQGDLVSAPSDVRYIKYDGLASGGNNSTTELRPIVPINWEAQFDGPTDTSNPAPLMEWEPVDNVCANGGSINYQVRVYRGPGISVHVATFYTQGTKLRPNGIFKDDNTGLSYYWRVQATCSADGRALSPDWDQIPNQTIKGWTRTTNASAIPANYSEDQNGAPLLKWTPQYVTGANDGGSVGYLVEYRSKGDTTWRNTRVEYPYWMPSSNGLNLAAGTYEFRVRPLDANWQEGRASAIKEFVIAPSAPPNVTATPLTSTSFNISWGAPSLAEGYQVQIKREGADDWQNLGETQQTSWSVIGQPQGSYNVRVRAVTRGQWSPWSTPVTANLNKADVSLKTVENAILATSNRKLEWSAVPNAARYRVNVAATKAEAENVSYGYEVIKNEFTPTDDLRYGQTYFWSVTALSEDGKVMGSSGARSFRVTTPPSTPALQSITREEKNVRVNWAPLTAEQVGSSVTARYVVRYRKQDPVTAQSWETLNPTSGSAASQLVQNLPSNTNYEFQVAALTSEGQSPWSGSGVVTTSGVPYQPGALNVSEATPSSVKLTWWAPDGNGANVSSYRIRWKGINTTAWRERRIAAPATEYKLTGLSPNVEYSYEVAAVNSIGVGPAATIVGKTVQYPSVPRSVSAVSKNGSILVRWARSATAGSSPINEYVVEARNFENGRWGGWYNAGWGISTSLNHTVWNGTRVQYRVYARNADGVSKTSSIVEQVAGKPGAARVKAKAIKKKKMIRLTFAANSNGLPVNAYAVQYSTNGKTWRSLKVAKAGRVYNTKVGKRGKYVYFRAAARNGAGYGAYGAAVKVRKR